MESDGDKPLLRLEAMIGFGGKQFDRRDIVQIDHLPRSCLGQSNDKSVPLETKTKTFSGNMHSYKILHK